LKQNEMNETPPPPDSPPPKPRLSIWAVVLIGAVALVGMFFLGKPFYIKARIMQQTNACIFNLRFIDAAKTEWYLRNLDTKTKADTPTQADVEKYIRNHKMPVCPAGGTYSINACNQDPTCTIPTHKIPPE